MNDATEGHEVERAEPMVAESGMVGLLNKSEIDQQIATAHKYPRSLKRFRDSALQMVTLTEDIARECIYALPRDNKTIEGPSARFADEESAALQGALEDAALALYQGWVMATDAGDKPLIAHCSSALLAAQNAVNAHLTRVASQALAA